MSYEQKYLKYKQKYLDLKNQIGGDGETDVSAFAKEKGMTLTEFHIFLLGVDYYKKRDPLYDHKGLHNPMIIGDYVVRAIGHKTQIELQVRPKEATDTPIALIAMANVSDNVYVDKENNSKYVCINSFSDY